MILEYKGINVFYTDQGKGNAIVLLHGFLENSNMWREFIPALSKKNRVICIDLLGHGKTECLGYVHSMELMADVVEVVLRYLKIRRSFFVGHSMGGYVALAFAEKNPDALKGLVLMNSTARADTEEKKANRERAILTVKQNHKTFIRMAIGNLFRPKNRKLLAKEIKVVVKEALETPLQGVVAALEGMKIREDREVLLHFTPYRKMIILGKKDPVLNYDAVLDQVKETDVEIVEFPDGHMSHMENKDDFLLKLVYFIENK